MLEDLGLAGDGMSSPHWCRRRLAETVYHRGNTGEPETLDPDNSLALRSEHAVRPFRGSGDARRHGKHHTGAAESWTISDDQTVYTFTLRKDAVWSNGDPVTADDFVYSFRRLVDPATAAGYASMLYVVRNAEAINSGKLRPEEIGVRAIDARTLEITLNAPTPYFLEMLMHQATYPVHRATVERSGLDWTKPGNSSATALSSRPSGCPTTTSGSSGIPVSCRGRRHARRRDVLSDRGSLDRDQALPGRRAPFER